MRFHRPVIDDCVFDRCGVLVETPLTQSVNAPVLQSCTFRGAGAGILVHTREHGADFSVGVSATDCSFEDIPGDAVRLRQSDPRGMTYLMIDLNGCRFTRCFVGVKLWMDVGSTGPTNRFGARVQNCAFRLSSRAGSAGISAAVYPDGATDLEVQNCTFQYGTTGIATSSSFGSSRFVVSDSLFRAADAGVEFGASGVFTMERSEFRNCRVGRVCLGSSEPTGCG